MDQPLPLVYVLLHHTGENLKCWKYFDCTLNKFVYIIILYIIFVLVFLTWKVVVYLERRLASSDELALSLFDQSTFLINYWARKKWRYPC